MTAQGLPLFDGRHPKPAERPKPVLLDVRVPPQNGVNWCWAAVGVGILENYGAVASQCGIATQVIGHNCCPDGAQDGCDTMQELPPALGIHFDWLCSAPASKTKAFIKDEIDSGRPIAVRIRWADDALGHFVVIGGYLEANGNFDVYVCDPELGLRTPWRFSRFSTAYENQGSWDITYKTR